MPSVPEERNAQASADCPYMLGILTTAIAAGALNVAASLFAHPRAYDSLGALLVPLALSAGLVLVVSVVAFVGLGRALEALRVPRAAAAVAIGIFLVLLAGFLPVLEQMGTNLTPTHDAVLWAIVGCALVALAGLGAMVTARIGGKERDLRLAATATLGVSLVALEALLAAWLLGYPLVAAGSAMPLLVIVGSLAAGVATVLAIWRLGGAARPARGLVPILVVVLASPLASLVGGDSPRSAREPGELAAGAPRHVVLISVDTLRPDMIGWASETGAKTPAIDALLADSVVFTNARAAAPWTKPSIASMLTGLSPLVHGTNNRRARLPDEVDTLAEHLRRAGYTTIGVGLNAHLEPLFNFGQGFDEYFFPARDDYGISLGARLLELIDAHRWPELFPSTTAITDRALDRINAHAERPFFLWIHLLDPHWPLEPPDEFAPPPATDSRIGGFWGDKEVVTEVQAGKIKLGKADQARVRDLYRGEVEYVDANVGRLLASLKELGVYDEALVVFTSDHGEELWERGRFGHGHTMFDEVLRVPLAFKLPGGRGEMRVDEVVSNESLTPTLLELVGLESGRSTFTSSSLAAWMDDAVPAPEPAPIYGAATYYYGEKRAVVFEGLKAVLELDTGRLELYDLRSDAEEIHAIGSARPADLARGADLLRTRAEDAARLREQMGLKDTAVDVGGQIDQLLRDLGYAGDG